MFGDNPGKWLAILVAMLVAVIGYYIYSGWGLVTVMVHDAQLAQVIHSIEKQGHVKIYTNLPLYSKVSMYVDHVPVAEAMETLALNVDIPAPDGDAAPPPPRPPDAAVTSTNTPPGASRPVGSGPGGRIRMPRVAQWNLAFFVGTSEVQVKQEIHEFETDNSGDDTKVFAYGAPIQLVTLGDSDWIAPDPRLQAWMGYKAPSPPPPPTDPNAPVPPPPGPPTAQTYLNAFAQSADIWIMAPGSWTPPVSGPPPPNDSIISAVKKFVTGNHGVVEQAIVLRAGRGGNQAAAVMANDDSWIDRMHNAINGMPADQRADALDQLNKEVEFRKSVQALPPDQRRQRMVEHNFQRMLYGERMTRFSPEKRASMYKRFVQDRQNSRAGK